MRRIALALLLFGCTTDPVRTFIGRRYDPNRNCLEPQSVLDVVVGDAGVCPLKCLVTKADGGTVAYTTLDCPPYPPGFDPTELDPQCKPAKAAYDAKMNCPKDAATSD